MDVVEGVVANNVPGALVECGVTFGGSIMIMILTLIELGVTDREIYLYDTFSGMSEPTEHDWHSRKNDATEKYNRKKISDTNCDWCYVPLDVVQKNLSSTNYPETRIHYVIGKVEDTVPTTLPDQIALLRLDTDWYESYKHELTHMFPLIPPGGTLINDDYHFWKGCQKAVDEYFATHPTNNVTCINL